MASHDLPEIDRIWSQALEELGNTDIRLISVSVHDPFRRTYAQDGEVLKIVLHDREITGDIRRNTPAEEYRILERLRAVRGVPGPRRFERHQTTSVLRMEFCEGDPVDQIDVSRWEAMRILGRLAQSLFAISLKGVAHNDVLPANVLWSGAGIVLIDFDQASIGSVRAALMSNFAVRPNGPLGRFGSFSTIAKFLAIRTTPRLATPEKRLRRAVGAGRGALRRLTSRPSEWPDPEELRTEKLAELASVWRLAAASNASSPGNQVAYYSLEVDGVRLPGERPWEQRWSYLGTATEFSDKRVLELGCNIGLLSTWLLLNGGAAAVLGVDHDPEIVGAARKVASVFGVAPQFAVVDFDRDIDWEEGLAAFDPDVVTALNVDHWLREPERFLQFLGRFPEVLFEGHDNGADEYRKLARLGFSDIRLVARSERRRPVFHAAK